MFGKDHITMCVSVNYVGFCENIILSAITRTTVKIKDARTEDRNWSSPIIYPCKDYQKEIFR